MLSRLARQSRSSTKTLPFTCKASAFSANAQLQVEQARVQPFFDAARLSPTTDAQHTYKVIEPQFYMSGRVVMEPAEYTIDCARFKAGTVNPDNDELRQEMERKFKEVGLVYLTNTGLTELQAMRRLVTILIPNEMNMEYKGGSNWRNYIEPNVYDTGAPKESYVHYHHEMAYIRTSPRALAFCAKEALPDGRGATYVSDQVQATKDLLSTPFGQKLKEKGICYVRCLTDEEHYRSLQQAEHDVYNHWQKSFGTQDPEEAAEIAQEKGLKIEWEMNHPRYGRYLKTRFYIDVYEYLPLLDKNLLFASVADHWMWFDTWPGVGLLSPEDRPLCITYGDDTHFSYDELQQFVDIYDKYGVAIPWNKGDIGVICNYRWAHGRPIYDLQDASEQRELGVILGQVFERQGQKEGKWF